LTPIVYPINTVPEVARGLIIWNPLYPLIVSYQRIIVEHQWPVWSHLWPVCILATAAAVVSEAMFRHLAGAMVDEL